MLVFGFDLPLVEVVLIFALVIFVLLVETIVIISLLVRQLSQAKELSMLLQKLSDTLLEIKKVEIIEMDRIRGRRR